MNRLITYKWYIVALLIVFGGAYYYFGVRTTATVATPSFYVINTVAKGEVSSGIHTTGEIVAEQKLALNVYKQLSRIDTVSVVNGGHVEKGAVLISFDKSDALVNTETSRLALSSAELALQAERATAGDPNTKARTLQNQITTYTTSIENTKQSIKDAYQAFLNTNLEIVPDKSDTLRLADKTAPTLSGKYVGTTEGSYVIDVYASGASSGYSFRVNGIESGVESIYFGKAINLGTHGLQITFSSNIRSGDTWVVQVPNNSIATYAETKRIYEQKVADLNVSMQGDEVSLNNAKQDLKDLLATDTNAYRDLNVEQAALSVSSEQQKLNRSYDVLKERSIVAPFSGTIQDMTNVVVGATPTGGTSDTINLGTLLSDTFLTTFTLSASDVAKVSVGQKAKVTVTSFASQPTFDASISEISSLPSATGVAQYTVKAKLNYDRTKDSVVLREGVLADIEVVQEEKTDALRIPVSALTYESGKPTVKVVSTLTDAQKKQVEAIGIVRAENGVTLDSYSVPVELGIQGTYYAEVTNGLKEGDYIMTTQTTPTAAAASVVEQRGVRGGADFGGGGTSGGGTQNRNTTQTTSKSAN